MKNKPQDNDYFHFYNANPKDKATNDCAYRALSLFLDIPWGEVARHDAEYYMKHGMWFYTTETSKETGCIATSRIERFMDEMSCRKIYQSGDEPHIPNLRFFIDNYAEKSVTYLCVISGHMVTMKENRVWDTYDSSIFPPDQIFIR